MHAPVVVVVAVVAELIAYSLIAGIMVSIVTIYLLLLSHHLAQIMPTFHDLAESKNAYFLIYTIHYVDFVAVEPKFDLYLLLNLMTYFNCLFLLLFSLLLMSHSHYDVVDVVIDSMELIFDYFIELFSYYYY